MRQFIADGWFHALAVGTAAELSPLAQQAALLKGQVRDMPAWLHTDMARNEAYVAARLAVLTGEETALRSQLAGLDERHDLRTALLIDPLLERIVPTPAPVRPNRRARC